MKRLALALLWLTLAGCTTPARHDPRDPDVYRPQNPITYPVTR